MNVENNIIAIRKRDITLAHEAFTALMDRVEGIMNHDAFVNPLLYRAMKSNDLELCAMEKIKLACVNSPFDVNEVRLISGQRFPDIVANRYYGIEVKSTKEDHWTSTGSSIVETTRVVDVDDIYMLFGKLGGAIPQFRCRPYQEVLYDIAVTHSPRYLINMGLGKNESIFAKMGTTYDVFRNSSDPISKVRRYYREKAKSNNKQEMPWWITSDNIEDTHSFNIKLWNSLDAAERRELQVKCMILFPEALNPERNMNKYNNTTLWLCSYNQVVNPNVRDLYSAGGKITHVNGERLRYPVPQVFNVIVNFSKEIEAMLRHPSDEMTLLIEDFNPTLKKYADMYEGWLDIVCKFAKNSNVPLAEWIKKKPEFTFSDR